MAAFAVLVACKGGKAKDDAAIDATYAGGVRPGGGGPAPVTASDAGPPKSADCRSRGTAKLESNAGVDASCAFAMGEYEAFAIGRKDGPRLGLGILNAKGRLKVGVPYAFEGNKIIGAFFNEGEAKALAARPIPQATLSGIEIPADKGTLGLAKGTVTFKALPKGGAGQPFEAEFDLTFESTKVVTEGTNIRSVKTGMDFHLVGSIVDR